MKLTNPHHAYAIPHGDQFTYLGQTFCIRSDAQDVTHRPQEEIVIDWIREHEENEPIYPSTVLNLYEHNALSAEIERCVGEFSVLTDGLSSWVREIIRRYTKLAPVKMPAYPSEENPYTETLVKYGPHELLLTAIRDVEDNDLVVLLSVIVDGVYVEHYEGESTTGADPICEWCWAALNGEPFSEEVAVSAVNDIVDRYLAELSGLPLTYLQKQALRHGWPDGCTAGTEAGVNHPLES